MSQYENAPVQDFYGPPGDPVPRVPHRPQAPSRRHWVSTLIVGTILLLLTILGASTGGLGGVLIFLALACTLTGIYIAITGRKSWAHVPGGRRAGAILIGVSLVLLIIGAATLPSYTAESTDTGQPTTVVEPEQAVEPVPAVAPAQPEPAPPAPEPAPEPEPVYVAPEPEPVYEAPAPAVVPAAPSVRYQNCTEVKNAGAAPIRVGDPGWDPKFDRDGDGTGCDTKK